MAGVAALMSRNLVRIGPEARLPDAARAMVERRVGSILVFEGERLVGILTERDVLREAASGAFEGRSVAQAMTANPDVIGADESLEQAAVVMLHGGFRHLPVVEGGRVVGILSMRDLLGGSLADVMPRGV
jgi:CBS domain-containing protein